MKLCGCIFDWNLLKNYNKICDKISNSIQKEFDSKPLKKYLKTRIKSIKTDLKQYFMIKK